MNKSIPYIISVFLFTLLFSGGCSEENNSDLYPYGGDTTGTNDRCPPLTRDIEQEISEDELLDLVQRQTLKYFWDFAEPQSGMARERNTSGNLVTTGGT